jgi:proline iminopeptidase
MTYPGSVPYAQGMLDVGDGNCVHWTASGRSDGISALLLHGGPGSGSSDSMRNFFDPKFYRIIQFDQRGAGRSTPSASAFETDMSVNTTWHLVADIERLRLHLGVDKWLVFGISWGCTLGLAYAQAHRDRVSAMVLAGATTTRRSEIDWLYKGLAPLFPEQWARFRAGVPEAERDGDLVAAYYRLLNHADPQVRFDAARNWHDWEAASITVVPGAQPSAKWSDPDFRMKRARIIAHYFHHNAWLEDGMLLRNAVLLAGIPGVIVQGRLDLEAPLATAWELSRVWDADLVVVPNAGHSPNSAGMSAAIVTALDGFTGRLG